MDRTKRRRMVGAVAAGLWLAAAGWSWAATAVVGGVEWEYTVSGGTAVVTGANPATGALSIPAKLGGYNVAGIGEWALAWNGGLSSVTISSNVTDIADYAFRSCSNLLTVAFGNKVASIGEYAFADCRRLTSLTMPVSVTNIGNGAFSGCANLARLVVPMGWKGTSMLVGTGLPDGCDVVYGGVYEVTLDRQGGTGGTASVSAIYGRAMPAISVPTRVRYVFGGYFSGKNGTGTQYYTSGGASKRNWDKNAAGTLYAKWTVAGTLARASYYDIDGPYWDVDYGTPAQPLLHPAYATATGGTNITWTTSAQGARTAWIPGAKDPGILQRAVNEARSGDTIKVAPGSYSPVTISKDRISIVSTKGRMRTYINALFATRCVDFGSTKGGKIEGFTLVQGSAEQGGGIYGGAAVHCLIEGCRASYGGGAAQSALTDCILSWNTASSAGGGAYGGTLLRCEVRHNAADIGGGAVAVTATCSLLAGNQAEVQSGAAERSALVACTVVDNRAPAAAGVYSSDVKNSILHGNRLGNGVTNNYAVSTCQYTCAWPVPAGTGNFNALPNFVDQANENYHLNNYSKCRDKGNKNLSSTRYDLSGLDRVMGANVDVGCYEYATGVTPLDPADYDGDGQPDVGFFNPKNGTWFLKQTSDGTVRRVALGNASSTLVPRDYDGDGIRDPAVYDSDTGTWKIVQSGTKGAVSKKLGWKGITAVDAADYDGDGKADPIIFNPSSKTWQILQSRNGATAVVRDFGWGGIRLFCGDYDGDGHADLGFYAPSSSRWYARFRDGSVRWVQLGRSGVRPCPVDADVDGALDPGYFAPDTGKWTVRSFVTGSTSTTKFGDATTTPHPFDWNNDGVPDTLGTYSPYRAGFLDLYRNPNGTRTAHTTNF